MGYFSEKPHEGPNISQRQAALAPPTVCSSLLPSITFGPLSSPLLTVCGPRIIKPWTHLAVIPRRFTLPLHTSMLQRHSTVNTRPLQAFLLFAAISILTCFVVVQQLINFSLFSVQVSDFLPSYLVLAAWPALSQTFLTPISGLTVIKRCLGCVEGMGMASASHCVLNII